MDMLRYQALAQVTANVTAGKTEKILNGCMGLCGEAGECIDALKKHLFQGHGLDVDHMIEECGDCWWYVAELATALGVGLDVVAERNIEKLRKRYPNGFDAEHSVHRTI